MTNQEVFDKAYTVILEQGIPSIDPDMERCVYRGPNGVKCVAGHFITDEEYNDRMEIFTADEGTVRELFVKKNIDPEFMRSLQAIHDGGPSAKDNFIPFWKEEMKRLAARFELSAEVIKD